MADNTQLIGTSTASRRARVENLEIGMRCTKKADGVCEKGRLEADSVRKRRTVRQAT
jgi:hypothetical protein